MNYSLPPGAGEPALFCYEALIIHGARQAGAHSHSCKESLAQVLREEPPGHQPWGPRGQGCPQLVGQGGSGLLR